MRDEASRGNGAAMGEVSPAGQAVDKQEDDGCPAGERAVAPIGDKHNKVGSGGWIRTSELLGMNQAG